MRKQRLWDVSRLLLVAALIVVGTAGSAFAQTSSSANYKMTESDFNSGASLNSCSATYCARASLGDIGAGSSKGTNNAAFGSITSDEPMLEVIVDPGISNLGVLSTETTATKTTTVKIRNYLSDGYTLQIKGDPPKYANHTLNTPSTPTASTPGIEQFGINVAANTTPAIGAAPVQVPSDLFSFGTVTADYATPNLFKYDSEDVIARSLTSSGQTDYTISMIVNISNSTPAGLYKGAYSAVVIPFY